MTRYSVVWPKSAQHELADLWLSAQDRGAVTAAADEIDRQLAEDAPDKGVELSEGMRAFFAPPLRVLFAVRNEDRVVEVLRVRLL
ncbi:MAG: type II toxin-antitoxin system RelE/ParE family toxin [Pirellulales bacterium]